VTTYLLDANVLIALTVAEHEHHERASTWADGLDDFAICPVVEGALLRFLVRIGESVAASTEVLRAVATHPRCHRWPDSVSYLDADLTHVRGHRQLTDAYLASLAAAHGGVLATLDVGLATALPAHTLLLPG
jgi:toxin-antitoxin system PIN domain toxin